MALNPLIKVMNLVALLILPLIIKYPLLKEGSINWIVCAGCVISLAVVIGAIAYSKKESFGKADRQA